MAGLYLGGGVGGGLTSSAPPSGPSTLTARAFGVDSGVGQTYGPRTAGLGAVATGILATSLLVLLWYSLPR